MTPEANASTPLRVQPRSGLNWYWQLLIFLLAGIVVFSRRPDAFLYPQFYAEDGAVWYAEAYNLGWWHSLLLVAGGYSNLLPRLVAGLALWIPFQFAPLLMNVAGLGLQVLPVMILLSSRCAAWGSVPFRLVQAALYLALPNSREVHVVLTNAQWRFALSAFLITFASPPPTWAWRAFDCILLVICGLTGPFGIALLPLAVFFWWKRRQRFTPVVITILAVTGLIQLAAWIFHPGEPTRITGQLGATPVLFFRLLSGELFVSTFRGENIFVLRATPLQAAIVTALGLSFLIYCALKANLELRLLICFSAILLAASLRTPLIAGAMPQWQLLENVLGGRYWFFPTLSLAWSLLWLAAQSRPVVLRPAGILALLLLCRGIKKDWCIPPFQDEHFLAYVEQFKAAAPGSRVNIPLNPGWVIMRLVKKR